MFESFAIAPKARYQPVNAGEGAAHRPGLLRRHQPRRLHARHHQGDLAPRRGQPRLPRRRARCTGIRRRLCRAARRYRGARPACDLRVLVDILAGASAGGINAIFLAHAHRHRPVARSADRPLARFAPMSTACSIPTQRRCRASPNSGAVPFAWALTSARGNVIDQTVERGAPRRGPRQAVANFVRARWFAPPFGGPRLHQPAARRVRRDGRRRRRARRCCPTISRSTCSSPSPISTAIPSRSALNSPAAR